MKGAYIHVYSKCRFIFFLSIPIPGFIPSDRFVWNGPVRISFTDERSEEFRRSVSSSNKREKNKIFCFSEQEKNR